MGGLDAFQGEFILHLIDRDSRSPLFRAATPCAAGYVATTIGWSTEMSAARRSKSPLGLLSRLVIR